MRKPKPLTDRILAVACGWKPVPKVTSWGRGRWQDPRGKIHPDIPMFTVSPTDVIREIKERHLWFKLVGGDQGNDGETHTFRPSATVGNKHDENFDATDETEAMALCKALLGYIEKFEE
jgi:hypothetical protein